MASVRFLAGQSSVIETCDGAARIIECRRALEGYWRRGCGSGWSAQGCRHSVNSGGYGVLLTVRLAGGYAILSERIVVVLGAGASFDVDTGSTPGTDSEWKPPLVSSMFEGRESFYGLRRPYKGARRLAQVLHHRAAAGVLDMERELRALANSPDSITRRDFLDIPPYLRDVMYNVGLPPGVRDARPGGYVVSPGAYALLLHELLVSADSEVAFIVMNYDTLLERSLMEYDPESYKFDSFEDYVEPSRKALVVKPHGSVNWWAPMRQRVANLTWHQALDSISLDDIRSSAARKFHADEIRASHGATAQVDGAQHWMYPLITAPLADKEESDLVCPAEHLEALSSFMQDCGRYLFIGTSGFDTDVLAFMARHMP
jgi:hypothetical protein